MQYLYCPLKSQVVRANRAWETKYQYIVCLQRRKNGDYLHSSQFRQVL